MPEQRKQCLKGVAVIPDAAVAVGQRAEGRGVLGAETHCLQVIFDSLEVVLVGCVDVAYVVPRKVVIWVQLQRFLV